MKSPGGLIEQRGFFVFENLFHTSLGFCIDDKHYDNQNIEIIDNTEDEILQATIEMLDKIENRKLSHEFLSKNERFKSKINSINADRYEYPLLAMANISLSYLNKNFN